MAHRFTIFILCMITGSSQYALSEGVLQKSAFTVEDSVQMVRIVDPNVALSAFYPPKINMSPNGKYYILVTRSGNLTTHKSDYALLLYQTDDVLAFLNKTVGLKSPLPKGRVLHTVSTSHNDMPFQKIAWLKNNQEIAFIGRFDKENKSSYAQVYKLNIHSGETQQLTRHKRPITDFAFNLTSQNIVFASTVARTNNGRTKSSYLAGVRNINSILNPNWEYPEPAVQYYTQTTNQPDRLKAVGNVYKGFFPTDIWLSPDGRKAIVLTTQKTAPQHWLEGYNFLKDDFNKRALAGFDENTMLPREDLTTRFTIIDMETGNSQPIFDAPTGLWKGGSTVDAYWLPNSTSVILANTALPLDVTNREERESRRQNFFTVEYDLISKAILPIARHRPRNLQQRTNDNTSTETSNSQFYGLEMNSSGVLKIKQRRNHNNLTDVYFKKIQNGWHQTTSPSNTENTLQANRLALSIDQDLNSSPEIMAHDIITGHKHIITDFNPQFRDLTFGKVGILIWTAPDGREWHGGLVTPPNYKKGQLYPLIIQTHGFNPQEFLIDGPYGTASAFAAQALANQDMFVLQMAEPSVAQNQDELTAYRLGFESAIDHLAKMNLIDRRKVGLVGWSSTGVDVQHMLLSSDYPIAAATIADSYNFGMLGYINQFGARAPGMAHMENMIGGTVPWGQSLNNWVANNPTLHLDRIITPLRYEQYETVLSSWWENYAILKRQNKPVEYYVFNDAAHALIKPEHRLASQQGTVDWFTFWLKGEEDRDPAKIGQYIRWHKLRAQQKESELAAREARR